MAETRLPVRTRSFSTPAESVENKDVVVAPLGFDIAGESFEVLPEAPGIVLLEFIEATTSEEKGANAAALTRFLKSVMSAEEWKRLNAVFHDPKHKIDIKTISEVVGYVIESYTSRPSEAS
jgi:hypothetical protein